MIKKQKGFIALTTAALIGIMMLLTTTAMVAVNTNEARQASDSDKSTKAYYAALGGAETAILQISNNPAGVNYTDGNSCSTSGNYSSPDPLIGVSCAQVVKKAASLSGYLQSEEAYQSAPLSSADFDRVTISWHQQGTDPAISNPYSPPGNYTQRSAWTFPAVLELTDLQYNPTSIKPGSPADGSGGIEVSTILIRPGTIGGTDSMPTGANKQNLKTIEGRCDPYPLNGYNCQMTVIVPGGNTHILRLRPRYVGMHYKLEYQRGAGSPAAVDHSYTTIDVTGRDNDTYRRVVLQIPNQRSVVTGFDFVLFSDTNICKYLEVRNASGGSATSPCPGLVSP